MLKRMSFLAMLLISASFVMAQAQGGGGFNGQGGQGGGFNGQGGQGGQGGRGGGRRGGGDPAAVMEFQLQNIKDNLAAPDDEWAAVLKSRVQAVLTAQQETNGGRGNRGGRGGGQRGGGNNPNGQQNPNGGGQGGGGNFNNTPTTALGRAMQELRDTLNNTTATPDLISQKLAAVRDARTRADAQLVAAQEDLKKVLTARQEALMVTMGYMQ